MVIHPAKMVISWDMWINPMGEHDDKAMDLGWFRYCTLFLNKLLWWNPQRPEMGWKCKLRWTEEIIYWSKPETTVCMWYVPIQAYCLWSALSRYRHITTASPKNPFAAPGICWASCSACHASPVGRAWDGSQAAIDVQPASFLLVVLFYVWLLHGVSALPKKIIPSP